jgi:hypothetical protein
MEGHQPQYVFKPKNPNLGKFMRTLVWRMFIYFMATWKILWRVWIFYDHLVQFVFIWYIFPGFGNMYQEKSGNPGWRQNSFHKKEKQMVLTGIPARVYFRVARFFLVQTYQNGKSIPNNHKLRQTAINYTKWS